MTIKKSSGNSQIYWKILQSAGYPPICWRSFNLPEILRSFRNLPICQKFANLLEILQSIKNPQICRACSQPAGHD